MNTTPSPAIEARQHELKCWPGPFDAMAQGLKTFEFRRNDRDFSVGDTLRLRRFQPIGQQYTGEVMDRTVTHILRNGFGLPDGYCVMSLDSPLLAAKQEELDKMTTDRDEWKETTVMANDRFTFTEERMRAMRDALEGWKSAERYQADYKHLPEAQDEISGAWESAVQARDAALRPIQGAAQ